MNKYPTFIVLTIFLIGLVCAIDTVIASPIAYWNFNEGEGNILNDNSENGYNGIVYGNTIWADGVSGNALSFDGVDDYVDIPNTSDLHFHSGFTLSVWAKFNNYNQDNLIVGKHISGTVSGYFIGVQDNKFDFYVSNSPLPGNKQRLRTPSAYNDNQWHHITGVYDGTSQYLYVDGVLIAEQTQKYSSVNSANIRMGGMFQGENKGAFIGSIDEIRIYDRALNKTEIYELANPEQEPTLEEKLEALEERVNELEERTAWLESMINKIIEFIKNLPKGLSKNWNS